MLFMIRFTCAVMIGDRLMLKLRLPDDIEVITRSETQSGTGGINQQVGQYGEEMGMMVRTEKSKVVISTEMKETNNDNDGTSI